ncbi:MAG: hypothetical protein FJ303_22010 [Planctomycetes bacterium]|nr:hypothetical protein [Planctomycetota bacterium]
MPPTFSITRPKPSGCSRKRTRTTATALTTCRPCPRTQKNTRRCSTRPTIACPPCGKITHPTTTES